MADQYYEKLSKIELPPPTEKETISKEDTAKIREILKYSPAIVGFSIENLKMPYALRTRKPPRNDPLLTACHDALPPDILEYILLLRVAIGGLLPGMRSVGVANGMSRASQD